MAGAVSYREYASLAGPSLDLGVQVASASEHGHVIAVIWTLIAGTVEAIPIDNIETGLKKFVRALA